MMARHQLSPEAKRHLQAELEALLRTRREIQFAVLHGSFLEATGFRDLDVAVWIDPALVPRDQALDYEIELAIWLERRLSNSIPVDVKVLNYSPLGFRYATSKGIPLLLRDAEAWYTFREETWRDYWDFLPFNRAMLADLLSPIHPR